MHMWVSCCLDARCFVQLPLCSALCSYSSRSPLSTTPWLLYSAFHIVPKALLLLSGDLQWLVLLMRFLRSHRQTTCPSMMALPSFPPLSPPASWIESSETFSTRWQKKAGSRYATLTPAGKRHTEYRSLLFRYGAATLISCVTIVSPFLLSRITNVGAESL